MGTILRPLSNGLYTPGKGVTHFFPHVTAPLSDTIPPLGYRLGDSDEVSVNIEAGEEVNRESTEYSVGTVVSSVISSQKVTVALTLLQYSNLLRAASLMGDMGVRSQTAEADVSRTLLVPGVYYLGGTNLQNVEVTKTAGGAAVEGTDYILDAVSGQIETLVASIKVDFDRPSLSTGFITGIASSQGIRGMLMFRGVNKQGVRPLLRLHDVQLRPSSARQLITTGATNGTIGLTGTAFPVGGKPSGQEIGYEMDITEDTLEAA